MLIIRGVEYLLTQIEEQILRDQRLSGNYQVVVTRDGHLGQRKIRCEGPARTCPASSPPPRSRPSARNCSTASRPSSASTKITVMEFDAIPRTQVGKGRRVSTNVRRTELRI